MARGKKKNTVAGSSIPDPTKCDTKVESDSEKKFKKNRSTESNGQIPHHPDDAQHVKTIREELATILKKHCPQALKGLDGLMEHYTGREEDLLCDAKKKYLQNRKEEKDDVHWPSDHFQWRFTLKYFPMSPHKKQQRIWNTDESLKKIQPMLEERAKSIGGECKMSVSASGQREYIVERSKSTHVVLHDKGTVLSTVDVMEELVRKRYRLGEGRPSDVEHEHERRRLDKERDQERKRGKEKRKLAARKSK